MTSKPKLLLALRANLRLRHFSVRTEEACAAWVRRCAGLTGYVMRPSWGDAEVRAFMTHLAVDRQVGPSTLAQALAALLFLYREVLGRPLVGMGSAPQVLNRGLVWASGVLPTRQVWPAWLQGWRIRPRGLVCVRFYGTWW